MATQPGVYTARRQSTSTGCISNPSNGVTFTVHPNPNPTITPDGPTTFCEGGSVNLDAGAGYASYLWSTGPTTQTINVSVSGVYTVTVTDANGCSGTSAATTVTVHPNPGPTITPDGPTTFCEGGSVNLDAGAGYASYLWSTGATTQTINVSVSGVYTVTVTDGNGCSRMSVATTVTVHSHPNVSITPAAVSINLGGSATLTASGAVTYSWLPAAGLSATNIPNPIASPSVTTTYTVTGTDANGCQNTATVTVTVQPVCLAPTGILQSPAGPGKRLISWNATVGAVSYALAYGSITQLPTLWATTIVYAPATSKLLTGLDPTVTYRARVLANCTSSPTNTALTTGSSVWSLTTASFKPASRMAENPVSVASVSLYPNPSRGNFDVSVSGLTGTAILAVHDATGHEVYRSALELTGADQIPITLNHAAQGVYLIALTAGCQRYVAKAVVE